MNFVESPFVEEVASCKKINKKLRKKIYKHTSNSKKYQKKTKDNSSEIYEILYKRQMPQEIIQLLKKRRNIDVASLKNMIVSNIESYAQIKNRTDSQQQQANRLYQQHKIRMEQLRQLSCYIKSQKTLNSNNPTEGLFVYSSTEQSLDHEQLLKDQQEVEYKYHHYEYEQSAFDKMQDSKLESHAFPFSGHFQMLNNASIQDIYDQDLILFNM